MNPDFPILKTLFLLQGRSLFSPSWPPIAALVNMGAKPAVSHLRRIVATACSIPPVVATDEIVVYKYLASSYQWSEVVPGLQASKTGGKKVTENITSPPYSIKEGDIFCCFVRPKPTASATAAAPAVVVARREDVFLRQLKELEKQSRKDRKQHHPKLFTGSDTTGFSSAPRKPVVEIALSLGGNLDFSDDDSESEGEQ